MRWRGWSAGVVVALAGAGIAFAQTPTGVADQRQRLIDAKAQSALAAERAQALAAEASGERDAATRARRQEAAAAARVAQAEAELGTGRARVALVDQLLGERRGRLAAGEAPVARLLGALVGMARRPALASIAQPGSLDDLVHVRAVFGAVLPTVARRTAGLRAELAATRALRADAALAAAALAEARPRLEQQRTALARMEAEHSGRAETLGRSALGESDRAIALGERARDIVDQIAASGGQRATLGELRTLAGPPAPTEGTQSAPPSVYRLPVAGRLITGFGELSDAGVRARGLTLAPTPGALVVAPAGGRVIFARRFRGYGGIVIVDHGAGWTSLVSGLSRLAVARSATVARGQPIGAASSGEDPRVTVELRRQGRPIDPAAVL